MMLITSISVLLYLLNTTGASPRVQLGDTTINGAVYTQSGVEFFGGEQKLRIPMLLPFNLCNKFKPYLSLSRQLVHCASNLQCSRQPSRGVISMPQTSGRLVFKRFAFPICYLPNWSLANHDSHARICRPMLRYLKTVCR